MLHRDGVWVPENDTGPPHLSRAGQVAAHASNVGYTVPFPVDAERSYADPGTEPSKRGLKARVPQIVYALWDFAPVCGIGISDERIAP